MPGVFSPTANIATKLVLYLLLAGLVTLVGGAWFFPSTTYATRQGIVQPQPVPFSHEHHVAGLGLDCRYCHTSVEESPTAGQRCRGTVVQRRMPAATGHPCSLTLDRRPARMRVREHV